MTPVTILGSSGASWNEEALRLFRQARRVFASRNELARLPDFCAAEKIELSAAAIAGLPSLLADAESFPTVIIASGDPLFCGVAATVLRHIEPEKVTVIPAPTAFQELLARLKAPWRDMEFFSAHGSDAPLPWRRLFQAPLAVLYGDGRRTARHLARELLEKFPEGAVRKAAVGCDLGTEEEYLRTASLALLADDRRAERSRSILALLPDAGAPFPALPLGLADENYLHYRQMITHPEVRAVILAKLRLVPGVFWDIGAGSGSVGIEAGGLCRGLAVYAVEKNPERFAELEANRMAAGVPAMRSFCGAFAEVAPLLPDPDRVFIGGGGAELAAIATEAFGRLKPGGLLAVSAVLLESAALLTGDLLKKHRVEVVTLNVSRAEPLGDGALFRAENPITIAVYRKERM